MNGNEPKGMPLTSEPDNPEIAALLERIKTSNDRTELDSSNIKFIVFELHRDALALVAEYERLREKFYQVEESAIGSQFYIDALEERLAIIADYADYEQEFAEEDSDDEPPV